METEYDFDPTIRQGGDNASNANVTYVESSRLLPVIIALASLALLVAGLSLGIAGWALSYADKARMESRILQVKVEGFENALHAQGIDPNPHLKGQPE